jgi:hypothetical protein
MDPPGAPDLGGLRCRRGSAAGSEGRRAYFSIFTVSVRVALSPVGTLAT